MIDQKHLSLNECILFYNAIIERIFLYGGVVWRSSWKSNIRRICCLPKKAVGVILGIKTRNERTVSLFKRLLCCLFMVKTVIYSNGGKNRAFRVRSVLVLLLIGDKKNWCEIFKPITKRSNRNRLITFNKHSKTALAFALVSTTPFFFCNSGSLSNF